MLTFSGLHFLFYKYPMNFQQGLVQPPVDQNLSKRITVKWRGNCPPPVPLHLRHCDNILMQPSKQLQSSYWIKFQTITPKIVNCRDHLCFRNRFIPLKLPETTWTSLVSCHLPSLCVFHGVSVGGYADVPKEFCNRGCGLSATIQLGTPETLKQNLC